MFEVRSIGRVKIKSHICVQAIESFKFSRGYVIEIIYTRNNRKPEIVEVFE
jgi:hypothetical protein